MVYQWQPGLANTNSYLVSGIPFLTGSTLLSSSFGTNNSQMAVLFPYVTRSITVVNRSAQPIRLHFDTISGSNVVTGTHYFTLSSLKDSITMNVKATKIYISLVSSSADGQFEIFAELTSILPKEMFTLTGSGINS